MKSLLVIQCLLFGFFLLSIPVVAQEGAGEKEKDPADEKTTVADESAEEKKDEKSPEEDKGVELAKQLANPIANLISLPFQYNYDQSYGGDDEGSLSRLNIQPVIPISLGKDWNLITRAIVPLMYQVDIPADKDRTFGLGDIVASQFFSPKEPTSGGWILGAGPAWLLPTATDDFVGLEKWGVGPTAIALKQEGPWTYGALANHIWSFAGNDDREDYDRTFLQPFAAYVFPTKTTVMLNTESTYDWDEHQWSIPLNLMVSQMFRIGKLPMQIGLGGRYWLDSPDNGPEGWGLRVQLTFLFPN